MSPRPQPPAQKLYNSSVYSRGYVNILPTGACTHIRLGMRVIVSEYLLCSVYKRVSKSTSQYILNVTVADNCNISFHFDLPPKQAKEVKEASKLLRLRPTTVTDADCFYNICQCVLVVSSITDYSAAVSCVRVRRGLEFKYCALDNGITHTSIVCIFIKSIILN